MAKKKAKKRKKKEWLKAGEAELFGKIKKRFSPPAWAIFRSVRNSTGWSGNRTADAVAMSLWPSLGLQVHGFEIKVSRGDWLRELGKPEKSGPVQKYCDRWWIVVSDEAIVDRDAGELPATWGLLAVKNGKLHTIVEAPQLEPEPLDRGFVAAILRKAHEANQVPDLEAQVREELRDDVERSVDYAQKRESQRLAREVEELKKRIAHFEAMANISGVSITDWNYESIAKTIGLVHGDNKNLVRLLENIFGQLDRFHGQVKDSLDELRELEKK